MNLTEKWAAISAFLWNHGSPDVSSPPPTFTDADRPIFPYGRRIDWSQQNVAHAVAVPPPPEPSSSSEYGGGGSGNGADDMSSGDAHPSKDAHVTSTTSTAAVHTAAANKTDCLGCRKRGLACNRGGGGGDERCSACIERECRCIVETKRKRPPANPEMPCNSCRRQGWSCSLDDTCSECVARGIDCYYFYSCETCRHAGSGGQKALTCIRGPGIGACLTCVKGRRACSDGPSAERRGRGSGSLARNGPPVTHTLIFEPDEYATAAAAARVIATKKRQRLSATKRRNVSSSSSSRSSIKKKPKSTAKTKRSDKTKKVVATSSSPISFIHYDDHDDDPMAILPTMTESDKFSVHACVQAFVSPEAFVVVGGRGKVLDKDDDGDYPPPMAPSDADCLAARQSTLFPYSSPHRLIHDEYIDDDDMTKNPGRRRNPSPSPPCELLFHHIAVGMMPMASLTTDISV